MSDLKRLNVDFSMLQGMTFAKVEKVGEYEIQFHVGDGRFFELCHEQQCCETVVIESIVGDLADLVGTPILLAEEATSATEPANYPSSVDGMSETWTFYKLRTIKGSVDTVSMENRTDTTARASI